MEIKQTTPAGIVVASKKSIGTFLIKWPSFGSDFLHWLKLETYSNVLDGNTNKVSPTCDDCVMWLGWYASFLAF